MHVLDELSSTIYRALQPERLKKRKLFSVLLNVLLFSNLLSLKSDQRTGTHF